MYDWRNGIYREIDGGGSDVDLMLSQGTSSHSVRGGPDVLFLTRVGRSKVASRLVIRMRSASLSQ